MQQYVVFPNGTSYTDRTLNWSGYTAMTPFEVYQRLIRAVLEGARHIIISDDFIHMEALGIAFSFLFSHGIVSRREVFIRLDITMYKHIGRYGFLMHLQTTLHHLRLYSVNLLVAQVPPTINTLNGRVRIRRSFPFPATMIWSMMITAMYRRITSYIGISNWTEEYINCIVRMRSNMPNVAIFDNLDRDAIRCCIRHRIPLCSSNRRLLARLFRYINP